MKTSKLNPYSFPVSKLANRGRLKKRFYKNWRGHKPEKLVTCPCARLETRKKSNSNLKIMLNYFSTSLTDSSKVQFFWEGHKKLRSLSSQNECIFVNIFNRHFRYLYTLKTKNNGGLPSLSLCFYSQTIVPKKTFQYFAFLAIFILYVWSICMASFGTFLH